MEIPLIESDEETREAVNSINLWRLLSVTLQYFCKNKMFFSVIIVNCICYFFVVIFGFCFGSYYDLYRDYNTSSLYPMKVFDEFSEINVYPINDVALFINESSVNYSNIHIRLTNDKREFDEGIKNSLSGNAYFNLENVENDQIIDFYYKSNRRKENYQKRVSLPFISALLQTHNITVQQESGKLPQVASDLYQCFFMFILITLINSSFSFAFGFFLYSKNKPFLFSLSGVNRCKMLLARIISILIYAVFASFVRVLILLPIRYFGGHNLLLLFLLVLLPKIEKLLIWLLFCIFFNNMLFMLDEFRLTLIAILISAIYGILFNCFADSNTIYAFSLFSPTVCQFSGFAALFDAGLRGYSLSFGNLDAGPFLSFKNFILTSVIRIIIYFVLYTFFELFYVRIPGSNRFYLHNICSLNCIKAYFSQPKEIKCFDPDAPFIRVEDISKSYSSNTGKLYALNNTSFTIEQNEIIVLVGPDGSGKSTLINSITGIIECDSGTLYLHGQKAESGFSEIQKYLGISFQEDKLTFDGYKKNNEDIIKKDINTIIFYNKVVGVSDDDLQNIFSLVETDDNETLYKIIPYGQKRRLDIALALFGSPKFVVLDEPTRGVGFASKQIIWKAISQFKNTKTIFITSRYLEEEAESIASRIFIMKSGNIINQGTPSKLRCDYKCGYKLTVTGSKVNMKELVSLCDKFTEDSEFDEDENAILIPESEDISDLLDQIEQMKTELGIDEYTISLKRLSDVISRLVADEEIQRNT